MRKSVRRGEVRNWRVAFLAHRLLAREKNLEGGPEPRGAVNLNPAVMCANDPRYHGQPQSSPCELRAEEGLERAGSGLIRHSGAGIGDGEPHILFSGIRSIAVKGFSVRGPYINYSILRTYGFRRVDDQIHDHLTDLRGIRQNWRKICRKVSLQDGVLGNRNFEQLQHLRHK